MLRSPHSHATHTSEILSKHPECLALCLFQLRGLRPWKHPSENERKHIWIGLVEPHLLGHKQFLDFCAEFFIHAVVIQHRFAMIVRRGRCAVSSLVVR